MQRRLTCIRIRLIDVGASLDQELTQAPVPEVGRGIKPEGRPERIEPLPVLEEEPDRADVAESDAPGDQRRTIMLRRGRLTFPHEIEDEIGATSDDTIEHSCTSLEQCHEAY